MIDPALKSFVYKYLETINESHALFDETHKQIYKSFIEALKNNDYESCKSYAQSTEILSTLYLCLTVYLKLPKNTVNLDEEDVCEVIARLAKIVKDVKDAA